VEGRNLKFEWRFAEGRNERLPQLASERGSLKVDVIFAINTQAAQAAKSASGTLPIVIARVSDPVRSGLVASLARPGGNVTGLSAITEELSAKRLQLLKEALPKAARVAVSGIPAILAWRLPYRRWRLQAPSLGCGFKFYRRGALTICRGYSRASRMAARMWSSCSMTR